MQRSSPSRTDKVLCAVPPGWPEELRPFLTCVENPGQGAFYCISAQGLQAVASVNGGTIRDAMRFCLARDVWPLRFRQNRGALTAARQAALLAGHVAVVGCGGLGGHVALLLARAGIGTLTLCDGDVFEESNLNRQAFCRENTIGRNKALAGKEELAQIASHMDVRVWPQRVEQDTLPGLLEGADAAVDCLDDVAARVLLEDAAHRAGIPFVHGAIAGLEAFALATFPGEAPAMPVLYGTGNTPKTERAEYRLGVPTPTPVAAALLQSLLVLRILCACPEEMAGRLWHLDLTVPELEMLRY